MPSLQSPAPCIMDELKASTESHHDAAESTRFNHDLIHSALPRDVYVESLAQMFLIHRRLEEQLRRLRDSAPALGVVIDDDRFQQPRLLADLSYFGRESSTCRPLQSTRAFLEFIDSLAQQCPAGLLGAAYVFEGSNNGAKFLLKAVQRAYQLPDGRGTASLDPYGAAQRENWASFKAAMNCIKFTSEQRRAIVQAATATFAWVCRLHGELRLSDEAKPAATKVREPSDAQAPRCPAGHR